MTHASILDKYVMELLPEELNNLDILDITSGLGSWRYQIRTRSRGMPRITGLDIWLPYIKRVCTLNIYDNIVCADAKKLPFRDDSFYIVLACEILEHLPKEEGIYFLDELERVTNKILIVTTLLGFKYQGDINDNIYEKHISSWQKEDLEKRGYLVRIIDTFLLPKTLKLIDKIRRWVFRLPSFPKEIIAIKSF